MGQGRLHGHCCLLVPRYLLLEWTVTPTRISAHLLREGFVNELLDCHGLANCDASPPPYSSSFVIDQIPVIIKPPSAEFVSQVPIAHRRTSMAPHLDTAR